MSKLETDTSKVRAALKDVGCLTAAEISDKTGLDVRLVRVVLYAPGAPFVKSGKAGRSNLWRLDRRAELVDAAVAAPVTPPNLASPEGEPTCTRS